MDCAIVHRLPGRLRLRLPLLAFKDRRDEISKKLAADERIKGVDITASCRSLTVYFDPGTLDFPGILALLDPAVLKADAVESQAPEPQPLEKKIRTPAVRKKAASRSTGTKKAPAASPEPEEKKGGKPAARKTRTRKKEREGASEPVD